LIDQPWLFGRLGSPVLFTFDKQPYTVCGGGEATTNYAQQTRPSTIH